MKEFVRGDVMGLMAIDLMEKQEQHRDNNDCSHDGSVVSLLFQSLSIYSSTCTGKGIPLQR
jgi:hypothetical protein